MKWEVRRYLPLRDSHKLHRSTKGETWELKSKSYIAFWNIYRCWSNLLSRWVWNQKTKKTKQKKIINNSWGSKKTHKPRNPINNSKSKLGKRENYEKQTFGSWLMATMVCFQAPRTALANSVAVSFSVWFGGGLGKQRWKRVEAFVWGLWVFLNSVSVWTLWRGI